MNFMESLGTLALGSQLKRVNEHLSGEVGRILRELGVDFEPRWLPLFALLTLKGDCSVVQAARQLGVSQPAISQFSKELFKVELIEIGRDPRDSRKRILSLSKSGRKLAELLRPIWLALKKSIEDVMNEQELDLLHALNKFEKGLQQRGLMERTMEKMMENTKKSTGHRIASQVKIVAYSARYKNDFKRLNEEWINEIFEIDAKNQKVIAHPKREILEKGGKIFLAVLPSGEAIGTCVIKPDTRGRMELSKMAVTKKMQGHRIGEMLLRRCIWQVKMLGQKNFYLVTNNDCKAAIHIYEKLGFQDAPTFLEGHTDYRRANVAMQLKF